MSAKDLTEMFNKGIINKSGNKVVVNYIPITGKQLIVLVIDVCRETAGMDGIMTRRVSTGILIVNVIFLFSHVPNTINFITTESFPA